MGKRLTLRLLHLSLCYPGGTNTDLNARAHRLLAQFLNPLCMPEQVSVKARAGHPVPFPCSPLCCLEQGSPTALEVHSFS